MTRMDINMTRNYHGFIGVNHDLADFTDYVMLPAEIDAFMQHQYKSPYAYPRSVANAFGEQPQFHAANGTELGFQLHADLETNQTGSGCIGFFTRAIMPLHFHTVDGIRYIEDDAAGLSSGTLRINTLSAINKDNQRPLNCLANYLVHVNERNALLLKVRDAQHEVIPNIAIFFPDRTDEASHKKVRFGEAFVLIKHDVVPDNAMIAAIQLTFTKLIKQQYGEENGLWMTEDEHAKLENLMHAVMSPHVPVVSM